MNEDFAVNHEEVISFIERAALLICNRGMKATREFDIPFYSEDQKRYVDGLMKIVKAGNDFSKWARGVKLMQYPPTIAEYGAAYSKALLLDEMIQDNHHIAKTYEEFEPMKDLLLFDSVLVLSSQKLVKLLYKRTMED